MEADATLEFEASEDLLPLLSQLKVMTRKKAHRVSLGQRYTAALLACLSNKCLPPAVAAEGANVMLNLCYERQNVEIALQNRGAAILVELLESADEDLQANAAGALQSLCFQPQGRLAVRNLGAICVLVDLLGAKSVNVRARAAGALHNISSDGEAIREIRKKGGIRPLIRLLHSRQLSICGSAAGALQNISREVASRGIIRNSDAVFTLVQLLGSSELQTQVCAAGALLNLLGQEFECGARRRGTVRAMRNMVLASVVYNLFFTQESRNLLALIESSKSNLGR